MNTKIKLVSILGLAALLLAAAAFGAVALSSVSAARLLQTEPPATTTPEATTPDAATPDADGSDAAPAAPCKGLRGGVASEDLANALGISGDELTAAYTEAQSAALAQAVADGLITQAQADAIQARGGSFGFGGRGGGWLEQNGIDFDAFLADALGVTPEALQAAYATAYNARIDQAVADGTLTQEQADLMKGGYALHNSANFRASMQSAFQAAVQQAVTDGVITQAQADAVLAQTANGESLFGGRGGFFGGLGGHGGGRRGGGRHGGWGILPGAEPSAAPDAPAATPSGASL